jgi:hypothetical protein
MALLKRELYRTIAVALTGERLPRPSQARAGGFNVIIGRPSYSWDIFGRRILTGLTFFETCEFRPYSPARVRRS